MGDKIYYLELIRASEGTLSRWSRLQLQPLVPTNSHWTRMVSKGPFLWVIHKEGLWASSRDINRLIIIYVVGACASKAVEETLRLYRFPIVHQNSREKLQNSQVVSLLPPNCKSSYSLARLPYITISKGNSESEVSKNRLNRTTNYYDVTPL
jgi:hypothetical protein